MKSAQATTKPTAAGRAEAASDAAVVPSPAVLYCHPASDDPLAELLRHLSELYAAIVQLADLAAEKLAAMRVADTAALQRCTEREAELLQGVLHAEQQRPAILARLAQALHRPELATARLAQIADHLTEPAASALRARSVALREAAGRLQKKNRLAAVVARNLQGHLRGVFAAVAKAAQESVVYGPRCGTGFRTAPQGWVDAVG